MKLNWNNFKLKNPDFTGGFEDLCFELFEAENELNTRFIERFHNQPGLEVEPVQIVASIDAEKKKNLFESST